MTKYGRMCTEGERKRVLWRLLHIRTLFDRWLSTSLKEWRKGERSPHYHATVRRPSAHPSPFIQTHKELREIPEFFSNFYGTKSDSSLESDLPQTTRETVIQEKKTTTEMFSNMFATVRFTMLPLVFLLLLPHQHYGFTSDQKRKTKAPSNSFDCGKSYLQQIFGFRFGQ